MKNIVLALVISLVSFSTFALEIGEVANDFTLRQISVDDSEADGSILKTNAPGQFLLLEFATTWCHYCQANLPLISTLADEVASNTTTRLVYVDVEAAIRAKVTENRALIKFDVALDNQKIAWRGGYSTGSIPLTYVIGPDGKAVYKFEGTLNEEEIAKIKAILGY